MLVLGPLKNQMYKRIYICKASCVIRRNDLKRNCAKGKQSNEKRKKMNSIGYGVIGLLTLSGACVLSGDSYELKSPDERIHLEAIAGGAELKISVSYDGKEVIESGTLLLLPHEEGAWGETKKVEKVIREEADRWIEPVVGQKSSRIREYYRGLTLKMEGGLSVEFRAYLDGIGYRFKTWNRREEVRIRKEVLELKFPEETTSYFPEEEGFISHNERHYKLRALGELSESNLASLPLMVNVPEGVRMLITESDLRDYPGMWIRGSEGTGLRATFPRIVKEVEPDPKRPDRNIIIREEAGYIAKTEGERSYPWRVFIISDRDGTFIESELVHLLASPCELEETEWIQPGKIAWDWYNALNIYGVDFEAGTNNETYKYYIDFASKYELEYIILDEGWSASTRNVREPAEEIDVKELVEYGKERNVGIILWSLWEPIDHDMEELFKLYESWGVRGVKIDFLQRSDQYMVNFYERAAREAGKHKLLLDFHGSMKPTGLSRTYPNVMTYEGVVGNEYNKWSEKVTAGHNVTIPFTRMAAGPMDYTPGAMANAQPENFNVSFRRPMSMSTRCHEVAKYIVFESALQMLCDSPSRYHREHETTSFISEIPVVWDETRVLESTIGDFVVVARRSGQQWFIGAMTNEDSRDVVIDFKFLPDGRYEMTSMRDGINAHRFAEDYVKSKEEVHSGDKMEIKLAPSGGWAANLKPEK